jgi:hypothetical protein
VIVGSSSVFAIESEITEAVPNIGQLALGFFVIHISGKVFGVKERDATMLGRSFGEVSNRLNRRGTHSFTVLDRADPVETAQAYLDAIYRDGPRTDYFGLSQQEFVDAVHSSAVTWAPDGDEAFDDGSKVLHMDVGSKVRLVAFINTDAPDDMIGTIREVWLDADLFYGVLSRWKDLFASEWENRLGLPVFRRVSWCAIS